MDFIFFLSVAILTFCLFLLSLPEIWNLWLLAQKCLFKNESFSVQFRIWKKKRKADTSHDVMAFNMSWNVVFLIFFFFNIVKESACIMEIKFEKFLHSSHSFRCPMSYYHCSIVGEMVFCFNMKDPAIPNTVFIRKERERKNEREQKQENLHFKKFSLDKMIAWERKGI